MKVREKARVLSVQGGRAEVVMAGGDDPARCVLCAMASHCRARERRFTVDASEGIGPGDEVTVEMELPSPALAAFLLFMLPLAAAFLAGGVVYGLTGSETLGLVAGAAGAALVYLVIHFARVGSKGVTVIVPRRSTAGGKTGARGDDRDRASA